MKYFTYFAVFSNIHTSKTPTTAALFLYESNAIAGNGDMFGLHSPLDILAKITGRQSGHNKKKEGGVEKW